MIFNPPNIERESKSFPWRVKQEQLVYQSSTIMAIKIQARSQPNLDWITTVHAADLLPAVGCSTMALVSCRKQQDLVMVYCSGSYPASPL